MEKIYLDNSASTPLSGEVKKVMTGVMENTYGNPSSLHGAGTEAGRILTDARLNVIKALNIKSSQIQTANVIFCGSGTEANNLAVFGTVLAKNKKNRRVVTTDSEHKSILEPLKKLESEGAEVIKLTTENGVIDVEELKRSVTPDTVLVTIMLVNNETGALYDVKKAFFTAKKQNPSVVTHCDAVQGFGKVNDFSPVVYGADMVSLSAHKIHGPKGVGALYCHRSLITSKKIIPCIFGGGQENGMRSGTENTIGIAGFGEAVKHTADVAYLYSLRGRVIAGLPSGAKANVPAGEYVPNIISVTVPGIKSEVMLRYLSGNGIYVSSGSACSSNTGEISYPLLNFGLSKYDADCTIRISLSVYNTENQIDKFLTELGKGVESLMKI